MSFPRLRNTVFTKKEPTRKNHHSNTLPKRKRINLFSIVLILLVGFTTVFITCNSFLNESDSLNLDIISPATSVQEENGSTSSISGDGSIEEQKEHKQQSLHEPSQKVNGDSDSDSAQSDDPKKQQHGQEPQKPLNIVLLYADDWSFKTLGAISPFVQTPNIDKMAKHGVLFTHNCVTTSICWVSRASLYTGQYASTHKNFLIEDEVMFREEAWNSTLFPLLAEHGYYNGMVGKWHHYNPPEGSFEKFENYYGDHVLERDGQQRHVTDLNEEDALEFLDSRPRDQPFALLVSFFATHAEDGETVQYRPQNRTGNLYTNQTVPIPKTATEEHFRAMPYFLQDPENIARSRWEERYATPEMYQEMMKKTYRMATEVDTACGAIIEKLKEQNILDSTLVIFTTDNGNLHGEHGLAEKWYPYEESIRVPLVVMDPRMPKSMHNTRNAEFTLNIDLAPTLLQAAQIPIPEVMQGRDFAPLYTKSNTESTRQTPWRKEFYYEWDSFLKDYIPSSLALVRKDSKYIVWPEYGLEELFHLHEDPYEEHNLFNHSMETSKETLDEIKKRFEELKALAEQGAKA